jgi:hypothetical protein
MRVRGVEGFTELLVIYFRSLGRFQNGQGRGLSLVMSLG